MKEILSEDFFTSAIMNMASPDEKWVKPYKTNKCPNKHRDFLTTPLLGAVSIRDDVAKLLRKLKCEVVIGDCDPHYDTRMDRVVVPHPTMFTSEDAFYHSLFHELGHWSGAGKRLRRPTVLYGAVSKTVEAMEEMVAELVAVFLCSRYGLKGYSSSTYLMAFATEIDPRGISLANRFAKQATKFLLEEA